MVGNQPFVISSPSLPRSHKTISFEVVFCFSVRFVLKSLPFGVVWKCLGTEMFQFLFQSLRLVDCIQKQPTLKSERRFREQCEGLQSQPED